MVWTPQTIGFHLCMFESAYHNDHSQRLHQYMYLQNWFYMEKTWHLHQQDKAVYLDKTFEFQTTLANLEHCTMVLQPVNIIYIVIMKYSIGN